MSVSVRLPCASSGCLSAGRLQRASLRVQAVAVPRNKVAAPAAAPQSRNTHGGALQQQQAVALALPMTAVEPQVHILTSDSYHAFLEANSDKLAIVDFFAVWCGPCKMIAPELERMANELDPSRVVFAKLDCGATNDSKKLAISLGIKALPTFHLYRAGNLADMMTGAKVKSLRDLICKHM